MRHSGEGTFEYGDITGYMGFSIKDQLEMQKCFNGAKSFEVRDS